MANKAKVIKTDAVFYGDTFRVFIPFENYEAGEDYGLHTNIHDYKGTRVGTLSYSKDEKGFEAYFTDHVLEPDVVFELKRKKDKELLATGKFVDGGKDPQRERIEKEKDEGTKRLSDEGQQDKEKGRKGEPDSPTSKKGKDNKK